MASVIPANQFLRYYLLQRGHIGSRKTWATYGQHIFQFFAFLEAQNLDWRASNAPGELSVVGSYRNHCAAQGASPRTINQRLSTITQFYKYALHSHWIDSLPFSYQMTNSGAGRGFLGHTDASGGRRYASELQLKVYKRPVHILAPEQIRSLLSNLSPIHKLMARLGLQAGLRREEIATFPVRYVHPPDGKTGMCRVTLDPRDGSGMRTKGSKAREVWMPVELMRRLWEHKIHDRQHRAFASSDDYPQLFLTAKGAPWSEDGRGFTEVIRRAGARAGFRARPHMLRHTYASYTLAALQRQSSGIDPLVFLQRQLGHSSVNTTMEYLHIVDQLVEKVVSSYDEEVSAWSKS
ncbi:tyrosine-type recombinase/integrase [Pseudoxanthomonas mexicana]|uniref:tyrosine-type recombinase/integrase n=1 Tax=Pseudoxanthomonas mexicana TaxID=128785 RepID=UPI00387E7606